MKTMLRVQTFYLLDKTAAACIGLLAVFACAAIFTASGALEGMRALDADRVVRAFAYRSDSALAIRLACAALGIFLGMHGFARMQRGPAVFFVASRRDVPRFAAAKAVAAASVLFVFTAVVGCFELVIGVCFTPYFRFEPGDARLLIDAFAEGLFFLLFQAFVTTLFDSVFAAAPAFALCWTLEANAANEAAWLDCLRAVVRHGRLGVAGVETAGDPLVQTGVIAILLIATVAVFAAKDVN